jgi:hypothetical protein
MARVNFGKPKVYKRVVRVPAADPIGTSMAVRLNGLYGQAVAARQGSNGAIRYGWPGVQSQRVKYAGYAAPPQAFSGYNPWRTPSGHPATMGMGLPYTSPPPGTTYTTMESATAAIAGGVARLDALGAV